MDRRAVVAWLASVAAAGCGGGGGGDAAAPVSSASPTPPASPAPAPAPALAPLPTRTPAPAPSLPVGLSPNIALWGDSLTPPVGANLQVLFYPNREVFNAGVSGQTSTEILARLLADNANHSSWINVFWYGHNNVKEPAKIKADIAASVSALAPGNARFLVLSVVNGATPEGSRGGVNYPVIVQLNQELAALYPQNYMDVRAMLVNQYNPGNPQEVQDFQNDVPPSSLRFDWIHLNNDGSVFVAGKLREFFDARGW